MTDRQFKKLRAIWYRKLARSGFADIENRRVLSAQSDLQERVYWHPEAMENVQEYYSWANTMISTGKFKSSRHLRIWSLHTAGLTGSEVGKKTRLGARRVNHILEEIRNYLKEKK